MKEKLNLYVENKFGYGKDVKLLIISQDHSWPLWQKQSWFIPRLKNRQLDNDAYLEYYLDEFKEIDLKSPSKCMEKSLMTLQLEPKKSIFRREKKLNIFIKLFTMSEIKDSADRLEVYGGEAKYWKIIDDSRKDQSQEAAIGAANAISILNAVGVDFSRKNLSEIRIPKANLSGALMDSVNLTGADLEGAYLHGAWLHKADLSRSKMKGVHFGEDCFIKQKSYIMSCCFSPDGEKIAFSTGRVVYIYLVNTAEKHQPIFALKRNENNYTCFVTASSKEKIDKDTFSRFKGVVLTLQNKIYGKKADYKAKKLRAYKINRFGMSVYSEIPVNQIPRFETVKFPKKLGQFIELNPDSLDQNFVRKLNRDSEYSSVFNAIAWDLKSQYLAVASSDSQVNIIQINESKELKTESLISHEAAVTTVAWAPSEYLVSASEDKTVRIWHMLSGKLLVCLQHDKPVSTISWNPCYTDYLAVGVASDVSGQNEIMVWDWRKKMQLAYVKAHQDGLLSIAWNPDGRRLMSCGWDGLILWQTEEKV